MRCIIVCFASYALHQMLCVCQFSQGGTKRLKSVHSLVSQFCAAKTIDTKTHCLVAEWLPLLAVDLQRCCTPWYFLQGLVMRCMGLTRALWTFHELMKCFEADSPSAERWTSYASARLAACMAVVRYAERQHAMLSKPPARTRPFTLSSPWVRRSVSKFYGSR